MSRTNRRWYPAKSSSMSNSGHEACPLCLHDDVRLYYKDRQREYRLCPRCRLINVPECFHLTPTEERRRYEYHRNSSADQAYRRFLQQLLTPLLDYLTPGQQGLDYGCGPGPTLSLMLQELGYPMSVYDPYFADDPGVLARQYDFITCSEAIEHFNRPAQEWRRLLDLLVREGHLAVMTRFHCSTADFGDWYYKNDPTHIHFYSQATFTWLAQRDGLQVSFAGDSVAIFTKTH